MISNFHMNLHIIFNPVSSYPWIRMDSIKIYYFKTTIDPNNHMFTQIQMTQQ